VKRRIACLALGLIASATLMAQQPGNVLVVVNDSSALSRSIAEYYARKRSIPERNICRIRVDPAEQIDRAAYDKLIARPIAACLISRRLRDTIFYIVTTAGVPLTIRGAEGPGGDIAAVDSELTLLYTDMIRPRYAFGGSVRNPMLGRLDQPRFNHAEFPIYLVTRLAGYDFADIRGLVDRSLAAVNRGKFVIDLQASGEPVGDDWLRAAARKLPADRVVLEETTRVLYDQTDVIGYASWGSNDKARHRRLLNFKWLPGAIMTEFVSTNARTFERPPETWTFGSWTNPKTFFAGSPQSIIGDYIHEGVTGTSGHVSEPYLVLTPRPDYLLPAYYSGRNLAESYYLAIPALSWQNIVVGDPLCALRPSK
jgi:uncharacterized protein (TIGR03790 family)